MFDSTEEMCVWGDSSEVQVVGHQEAGEVGRGRVQGGDGGPQQGQGLPSWSRCPGKVGNISGESLVMWTAASLTRTRSISTRNSMFKLIVNLIGKLCIR